MVLADSRQRITCEGWQGENPAGFGKTLPRVRSGFQIAYYVHYSVFSPWSVIGAALHTIRIPKMMEFLLSIVDAKSFLDVMFTCKLRLVLNYMTVLAHFIYSCSIYSCSIYYRIYGFLSVFSASCGLHLTQFYLSGMKKTSHTPNTSENAKVITEMWWLFYDRWKGHPAHVYWNDRHCTNNLSYF